MIFDRAVRRMSSTAAYTLAVDSADGWTTGSMPGTGVTGAMKLSAVNRCVECISDSISKLPIFVMDSKTKQHPNHPLLTLLERRPNEAMAPTVYKKLLEANRLLRGNSYSAILRSRSNARPVELLPLNPDCTYPQIDDTGKLWYITINPRTGERRKISQWDMLHYKAFSSDGITGISVLSRAQEVITTAKLVQRYEGKFYSQNAQPTGVLTIDGDLDKEAKGKVREEWKNLHEGIDNAFRIAVLDMGMKYQPVSVSNKESQFVESKAISVEDIARFFGVPLYKLMAGKQAYASNEQNGIEYVVNTLHPIVSQYEEEDSYKLLFDSELTMGLEIRRNMMAELRGDSKSRGEWYKIGREIGYFSVDDICDLEDTPHVTGGNTRNASLNYVPLELFADLSIARSTKTGGEKSS